MPSMRGYESVHPDISTGLAFYYADSNNQVLIAIKYTKKSIELSHIES
jgi:hypothetical protein